MLEKLRGIQFFGLTAGDLALYIFMLVTYGVSIGLDALPERARGWSNVIFAVGLFAAAYTYRREIRASRRRSTEAFNKIRQDFEDRNRKLTQALVRDVLESAEPVFQGRR